MSVISRGHWPRVLLFTFLIGFLAAGATYAARHWEGRVPAQEEKKEKKKKVEEPEREQKPEKKKRRRRGSGGPGNLAVIDFKVYELSRAGAYHRYLASVLVENQSPVNRDGPWRVDIRPPKAKESLGGCGADTLPQGQVALCEIWLSADQVSEGQMLEARLDRTVDGFHKWDGDSGNDLGRAPVKTLAPGAPTLRISEWNVRPQVLHGKGEVQFRFSIEGAHLAWLLVGSEEPKLLAGHPSDGLIAGTSTARVSTSGPVTIVARNSQGAYVYDTIPVLNTYDPPKPTWIAQSTMTRANIEPTATILDPGVYGVSDNERMLGHLDSYLLARDWTTVLNNLEVHGEDFEQKRERKSEHVLNPEAMQVPQPNSPN